MTFQERYAEEAVRWASIPVPFRHRGLTTRGCDCSGMLVGIAQTLGKLKSYKLRKYKFDWNLHKGACDIITTELEKFADLVQKSPLQPGDIPVFRLQNVMLMLVCSLRKICLFILYLIIVVNTVLSETHNGAIGGL